MCCLGFKFLTENHWPLKTSIFLVKLVMLNSLGESAAAKIITMKSTKRRAYNWGKQGMGVCEGTCMQPCTLGDI